MGLRGELEVNERKGKGKLGILNNKKGMFFTFTVIALLSLIMASYGAYSYVQDRAAINNRIDTMNDFVFSVEEDLPRKMYITGFRIIFLLEKGISESGEYVTDFNSTFEEAFFNGTIDGESKTLLEKVLFQDIEDSFNERGAKINVNVSLLEPEIFVSQDDPWNVKFSLKTNLVIEDLNRLASWNRTATIDAFIPIDNFEDPLYIVSTNGMIAKRINRTIYSDFSNVANLLDHVSNSYYTNSTMAPSFLDRFKGINAPNENGIESLVNLEELSMQGVPVIDKSVVDYIYFSNDNPATSTVSGMPSWFKIDGPHISVYS
jgi:hypothetical protein